MRFTTAGAFREAPFRPQVSAGSSFSGETRVSTQPASTPNVLAISPSEKPSFRRRSTSSARHTSPRSSMVSPRNCELAFRGYHARGWGGSDARWHLQVHAGVDLVSREIVRLADGLYFRPRVFPERGTLYCYPPERVSGRHGVMGRRLLGPRHTTNIECPGESGGYDQSPPPATTKFCAVSLHQKNIREGASDPNGIFPPPRSSHPVESTPCISRKWRVAATTSSFSTRSKSKE